MRDNLFRSADAFELRDAGDGDMPILAGHFARFNEWTEIDSIWEGRFMERVAPGAFKKTIRENRAGMRALFQHGRDPQVGDKPLGPIIDLREDQQGAAYEVQLLDTAYTRDLLPGLEAGLYGASFRMRVVKEDLVQQPKPSDTNPTALPERTIREAQVQEFGPVTFPAYAGATAGVRSLTDDMMLARMLAEDPEKLRALLAGGAAAALIDAEGEQDRDDDETSSDDEHGKPEDSTSRLEIAKARSALYGHLLAGRRA